MKKRVLINVEDKDIRVAALEDDQLCQLFVEQLEDKSVVGNVYKARVDGIVPGLQAAFMDIGEERNGFLHFSDIVGNYSLPGEPPSRNAKSRGRTGKSNAPELKIGDELLIQVLKEPMGTKGARVTMNISLPGRYLVLLPFSSGQKSGGVSRRIEDGAERRRLRKILKSLDADDGGFIIRTAGLERDEEEISADVKTLQRLWHEIQTNGEKAKAPTLVYDDHSILGRLVRDELTNDVDELIVDSKAQARELRDILAAMMPDLKGRVTLHEDLDVNLFERYDVESQFQKALRHRVWLKSGGYIIVDETEALTAIDVNSGKFVGKTDQEAMILKTNMEAAEVIARQLRLRDIGGIIVLDFIDMRSRENQRKVVREFQNLLKRDRAKTTTCDLSDLGVLEMTRKRVRQSLGKVIFRQCPYCDGSGRVLTNQQIWKNIKYEILALAKKDTDVEGVQITVHPAIRTFLENEVLPGAKDLANRCAATLNFVEDENYHLEQFEAVKV